MVPEIYTKYPLHIEICGPIERYAEHVELKSISGIYLRYLTATISKKNKSITLAFGPSLHPQCLEVTTFDGKTFPDWKLDDFDKGELHELCNELKLTHLDALSEASAKKLLLELQPNNIVAIPAYRIVSTNKT